MNQKVEEDTTKHRNDGTGQITYMMPLQPSNSLEDPIDGFAHTSQSSGPPRLPDGPTELIYIRLIHNLLPLKAFTPGTGM
jgi:hypothetical protein